jgi:hypothetical protein
VSVVGVKAAPNVFGQAGFEDVGQQTIATSDSSGRFEVKVAPGQYVIVVRHPAYPVSLYLRDRSEDGPAAVITVQASERREIALRMWRECSVEGRVIDDEREPLPGVEVSALRRMFSGGRAQFNLEARTETDDQGRYRFPQLTAGDYIVAIASGSATWPPALAKEMHDADQDQLIALMGRLGTSGAPAPTATAVAIGERLFDWFGPPGRLSNASSDREATPLVYRTYFHPGVADVASAGLVHVEVGQIVMNVDVALAPPVATYPVSGRLLGQEAQVAGVAVSLVPVEYTSLRSPRGFETATAVTDNDGRFVIVGVPSGRYVLQATVGGRAWAPTPGSPASLLLATPIAATVLRAPNRSDENIFTASAELSVGDAPVIDAALTLRPGARVHGRIQLPAENGPERRMVLSTLIYLEPVDRRHEGATVTARPDTSGRFQTPQATPGRYRLVVSNPDRRWRIDQILVNGEDITDGLFELTNEDISDALVTLTEKQATFSGTVAGAAAKSLQPRIVVFPADVERWIARGMHPWWATNRIRANELGEFRVANLRPGQFLVAAVPWDEVVELTNPDWVRSIAKQAARINVGWDPNPPVTIKTLATVSR